MQTPELNDDYLSSGENILMDFMCLLHFFLCQSIRLSNSFHRAGVDTDIYFDHDHSTDKQIFSIRHERLKSFNLRK